MSNSVKMPKALSEKYFAITMLTDAFSKKHLNKEYLQLIHTAIGALARKRPSPLLFRRTKASLICRRTINLRAVQLLLGHTKLESTVRYFGIEVEDALEMAKQAEV